MNKHIAYGYIRVSTSMQKEDDISLDTQTKKISEYCTYRHFDLVNIYILMLVKVVVISIDPP